MRQIISTILIIAVFSMNSAQAGFLKCGEGQTSAIKEQNKVANETFKNVAEGLKKAHPEYFEKAYIDALSAKLKLPDDKLQSSVDQYNKFLSEAHKGTLKNLEDAKAKASSQVDKQKLEKTIAELKKETFKVDVGAYKKKMEGIINHLLLAKPYTFDVKDYCHQQCCHHKNFKCGDTKSVKTKCVEHTYPLKCCKARCHHSTNKLCHLKWHCHKGICHSHRKCHRYHHSQCHSVCPKGNCHRPKSHVCKYKKNHDAWKICRTSPMPPWMIALIVVTTVLTVASAGAAAAAMAAADTAATTSADALELASAAEAAATEAADASAAQAAAGQELVNAEVEANAAGEEAAQYAALEQSDGLTSAGKTTAEEANARVAAAQGRLATAGVEEGSAAENEAAADIALKNAIAVAETGAETAQTAAETAETAQTAATAVTATTAVLAGGLAGAAPAATKHANAREESAMMVEVAQAIAALTIEGEPIAAITSLDNPMAQNPKDIADAVSSDQQDVAA